MSKKKNKRGKNKRGLKGFFKDLKDKVKKSPFLVLVPYKNLMQKKLKKKGITPKNDIKELAIQFYNEFVKRRNYDEYGMEIPYTDITVNHADNHADPRVTPEVVAQIIPAIINMLKNLISSIKSGKETDPELKEAAENAENEIKNIENKMKEDKDTGTAKWLIPVVAGIVALILVFVLMKRR